MLQLLTEYDDALKIIHLSTAKLMNKHLQYVKKARQKRHANLCSSACLGDAVPVDVGADPLAVLGSRYCSGGSGVAWPRAAGGGKNAGLIFTRSLTS